MSPAAITTAEALAAKISMLDAMADMEVAVKLLGTAGGAVGGLRTLSSKYEALQCRMEPLERGSAQYSLVERFLRQTHAPTHTEWDLKLLDAFAVDRRGEAERFQASALPHSQNSLYICIFMAYYIWAGKSPSPLAGRRSPHCVSPSACPSLPLPRQSAPDLAVPLTCRAPPASRPAAVPGAAAADAALARLPNEQLRRHPQPGAPGRSARGASDSARHMAPVPPFDPSLYRSQRPPHLMIASHRYLAIAPARLRFSSTPNVPGIEVV